MTNTNFETAKAVLERGDITCALVKAGCVHTSDKKGILPMVEFIESGVDLCGFSAADLIVGKAAALLFALAKVSQVYAGVMSKGACAVFEKYGIRFEYGTLTEEIINRQGTGACPMEEAVRDTDDAKEGFEKIKLKLSELREKNGIVN